MRTTRTFEISKPSPILCEAKVQTHTHPQIPTSESTVKKEKVWGRFKPHVPSPRNWVRSYAPSPWSSSETPVRSKANACSCMWCTGHNVKSRAICPRSSRSYCIEGLVEIPHAFNLSYSTNCKWRAMVGETMFKNYDRFKLALL